MRFSEAQVQSVLLETPGRASASAQVRRTVQRRVGLALLWVLALGLASPTLAQQTTRVVGSVRDEFNAISLPGVTVEVGKEVVFTDVDGGFVLDLPPGMHQVRVAMDGYQERTLTLNVQPGQRSMTVEIGLSTNRFAESVTVTAQATDVSLASTGAQLIERMRSGVVQDNLGAQEMRANADSDAAAAMQRVTGLSVVDNFVFVRGLGERYSNTTLNGSAIPTTEPDRKVVPLDLFPSGLLSSVSVTKSYAPDRSADFAGGLVEIVPLKFPGRTQLEGSWSVGFNSITHGEDVIGYAGGGGDWRGFDDGTRGLPSAVPDRKVIRGGIYTPDVGVLQSELNQIGRAFPNNWNLTTRSTRPNQNGSITFGTRMGKVGLLLSYTQSYKEQFNDERQVFYRTTAAGLSVFSDYQMEYATTRANVGAVGNVSFQPVSNHRFTWENFYTHSGRNETRTFEGFNSDIATNIRNQRLMWIEEDLLSTGVTGEHYFSGLANSRIDWRVTLSDADRDEPDLREVLYESNAGVFVLSDESQSGLRMFNTLRDETTDGIVNWSLYNSINGLPSQFKFGGQFIERTRDFSSRRFRYVPLGLENAPTTDLSAQPESIFLSANIGSVFELKEETRVTDAYAAEQIVGAGYGMADLALTPTTRLIAGARVERFEQNVDTFDLFDFEGDPDVIRASIEETDIFPAVNFVYSPQPEHNLRLSFSQTVNRPEFREVAPFEFTDVVGGRAVVGNPDLRRSLIQNYDVRYEAFPGAEEVLAASFFFKRFDEPIERIVEPTAQLRTSFTNADSARNIGIELEGRKLFTDRFLLGANYTFVDSRVTLSPAAAQVQTSLERPLAGQSKNLFNVMAEVRNGNMSGRVLYNFFGERISDVGSLQLPDIVEDGRGTLDFVFTARFADRVNFRFSADNLTDEDYEFVQGGEIQRLFNLGRTFSFNFGFSAF